MANVWIPALLRELTGGRAQVTVPGRTVSGVIAALEDAYPGMRDRLCRDKQLNPAIQVLIDGRAALLGLREPVGEDSEVVFVPTVSGG
jgi:molybdopterin synthase sulfur carrier subunit